LQPRRARLQCPVMRRSQTAQSCASVACRVDRPCIHAAATRVSTLPPRSG
jgi:hypothetical protein